MKTPADAVKVAMAKLKKSFKGSVIARHNEPAWHRVNNLITLVQHLQASNMNVVVAAFGYNTKAFEHLPTLRHFFAHRNRVTRADCSKVAASIPVPHASRPADVLLHRDYAKPMNVLAEWMTDMTVVADKLVR